MTQQLINKSSQGSRAKQTSAPKFDRTYRPSLWGNGGFSSEGGWKMQNMGIVECIFKVTWSGYEASCVSGKMMIDQARFVRGFAFEYMADMISWGKWFRCAKARVWWRLSPAPTRHVPWWKLGPGDFFINPLEFTAIITIARIDGMR